MLFTTFALLILTVFEINTVTSQYYLSKLNKNETFSQVEWTSYLERIIPKKDTTKPQGTQKQPAESGKVKTLQIRSHIIGGSTVSRGQLPWQAALLSENGSYFCGGSLISENFVLTAAHCVFNVTNIKVVLGALQYSAFEAGRYVAETTQKIIHPQWNFSNLTNNIALIKLPSLLNVTGTEHINTIRLPKLSDQDKTLEGVNVTFSGWGRTELNGSYSKLLNSAESTIISNVNCARYYGSKYITASVVCTTTKDGKSSCFGDGGGPLIRRERDGLWTIVGVNSFVSKSGCTAGPGGYTRVSTYLNWISLSTNIAIRE